MHMKATVVARVFERAPVMALVISPGQSRNDCTRNPAPMARARAGGFAVERKEGLLVSRPGELCIGSLEFQSFLRVAFKKT